MATIKAMKSPASLASGTASVASSGQASPRETSPPSMTWRRAVDRHLVDSSLTEEEQNVLRLGNLDDFMGDLKNVHISQVQKST